MSAEPLYYKLHVKDDGELLAIVCARVDKYLFFDIKYIITNTYSAQVSVGNSCYSLWITAAPVKSIRTVIHHWVHDGVERYYSGSGLNAELTPIPARVGELFEEKDACEARIREITAEINEYFIDF